MKNTKKYKKIYRTYLYKDRMTIVFSPQWYLVKKRKKVTMRAFKLKCGGPETAVYGSTIWTTNQLFVGSYRRFSPYALCFRPLQLCPLRLPNRFRKPCQKRSLAAQLFSFSPLSTAVCCEALCVAEQLIECNTHLYPIQHYLHAENYWWTSERQVVSILRYRVGNSVAVEFLRCYCDWTFSSKPC